MERLHTRAGKDGTVVVSSAAALPFPPVAGADIVDWNNNNIGSTPEFDLEIESDGTTEFTDLELVGGRPESQVLSDDDVDTVDFANDELDLTTHAYESGDGPVQLTTTDTLPTGLALATNYWIIKVNSGTIQLATSRSNAFAGTAVSFSDVGVGTHTIVDTADTERIKWFLYGLLGQGGDGVVSLTATKAYVQRLGHRPITEVYSIIGTPSAGNLTARVYQIEDQ